MTGALARICLLLALLTAVRGEEGGARRMVLSGVEQTTTLFIPINQHVVPTPAKPLYYTQQSVPPPGGAAPAEWFVQWVGSYMADKGYVETAGAAPLRLEYRWAEIDPQISHVGRPLQQVEVAGRTIINPRNAQRFRTYFSTAAPTCIISAYDENAKGAKPGAPKLVWQTKVWLVLYEVPLAAT